MEFLSLNKWPRKYATNSKTGFLHIPKTAGRTLNRLFIDMLPDVNIFTHSTVQYIESIYPEIFIDSFIFCIVRNPYERFYSACRHAKLPLDAFHALTVDLINDPEWNLKYPEMLHPEHFLSQFYYISDANGVIKVNYLGRYEALQEAINYLAIEKGLDVRSGFTLEAAESSDWATVLSEQTKRNIEIIYAKDFELLNYPMSEIKP